MESKLRGRNITSNIRVNEAHDPNLMQALNIEWL